MSNMRRRLQILIQFFPHVFSANLSYILFNIILQDVSYMYIGQIRGLE